MNKTSVLTVVSQEGLPGGQKPGTSSAAVSGDPTSDQRKPDTPKVGAANGGKLEKNNPKCLKTVLSDVDMCIVDASKEGNVGRFLNVR